MSSPSPYASRFRAAVALLAGIALGALLIAAAVVVTGRGGAAPSAPWSAWSPPDGGALGAREIAEHVAPLYRISATDQLAIVTVVDLANAGEVAAQQNGTSASPPARLQVAVQPDSGSSQISLLTGNTVAYNLCGVASTNCSIGVGVPSTARLLLLRREALELALYSFRYLSGVDNVVAILPPGHATQTGQLTPKPPSLGPPARGKPVVVAVLFVRNELALFLRSPLAGTLPEEFPPTIGEMASAPEAGLVDQVTARGLFSERIVQAQDGSSLLMLSPLPPQ